MPDKRVKFQQEKITNENKKAYILRKLNKQMENNSEDKEVKINIIFFNRYFQK